MTGTPIRVLLVDDQALIRAGFRALLEAEDDIEVVAEAGDGRRGVELASEHLPDVALFDVQMPVLDGIEATRLIAADPALAGVHVVILTNYGLDEYVFEALRAGAGGFMVKDTEPADLLHGVRVAARGDALLSPGITRRLIGEFVARGPAPGKTGPEVLTNREREVVTLVARGLSNDEIARKMVISPATAKTHVSRAMTKVQARDRAQLVVLAYESGLVQPAINGT
ncbi:DNA-binding NarL/FixJ family response regulator [Kribbella sp. VKM Ac-2527]|uniref:DNA-binding NarL/FixJ family response regulator n=1 Tax=Kribbella caucasensis TaxID=2512215 RepID=A0A4R6KEH0_9ACTN|nr:response regulator transcription factor [Kribbella sp. VKM Ac-2527]TDO48395.1 DNA-binding NarL/FixJ family response regulator [Kribbella sp. VKM Ac-2527]